MTARERIARFGTLLKVYREREARKAARMRQAQDALRREESQLEGLDGLRTEYRTRFEAAVRAGTSASTLKNYRRFINSLDDLRGEQQERTRKVEAAEDARRSEWIGAHQRTQGIENIEQTLAAELAVTAARQAQRDLDEAGRRR